MFLGRKRLGCRNNVCYHCYLSGAFGGVGNLAQYHFVCLCKCVCVSVLRMFSRSYQRVLGGASAPAFYYCNSFSFMCLVKKCKELKEIKSEEKRKTTLETNIMLNREGCGQKVELHGLNEIMATILLMSFEF